MKSGFRFAGRPRSAAGKQRGVVLFIALIVLVAMSLAGIALVRQTSADVIIAGNLAFKQTATYATDYGDEAARNWLSLQNPTSLQNDNPTSGFLSSWYFSDGSFSPLQHNWAGQSQLVTADDGAGNMVRFVVNRLCSQANMGINGNNQQCSTVPITFSPTGSTQGTLSYQNNMQSTNLQPYYRITVRVDGPRSTVSYAQIFVR